MNSVSRLRDGRIKADNYLIEMTIGEYVGLARDIIHKNEFQRRRVRSSKTVYSLLKSDLLRGCVLPPIVLALTSDLSAFAADGQVFDEVVYDNKDSLVILDGLQRTYTILEIVSELEDRGDQDELSRFNELWLRIEVYVGLNRLAILYRMLTLNTGQTPMSLRQQIEILYLDLIDAHGTGVELIREVDESKASKPSQYNFRDVVDGFNSYLQRNELPIDRADLLENIKSLEKLSKENEQTDLFAGYLEALHTFVTRIYELCGDTEVASDFREEHGTPFGKTALQVFKRQQAFAGFGAAIGHLRDFNVVSGFEQVKEQLASITIEDPEAFLYSINQSLNWLKETATKIGNAQRAYFQYYFRDLVNPDSDSFSRPDLAADTALSKYRIQNS